MSWTTLPVHVCRTVKYSEAAAGQVLVEGIYKSHAGRSHVIQVSELNSVVLPSTGHLDWLLKHAKIGSTIRVTYAGLQPVEVKSSSPFVANKIFNANMFEVSVQS